MFVGGAVGDALRRRFVRRNWLVPRRVMCILFWTGVLLIFVGMILLVTSQHKGRAFQSWGSVLLGLGLCVMLACLILCIHTYVVMSRLDNMAEQELQDIDKFVSGDTSGVVQPPSFDAADGRKLNSSTATKLAYPPRYGVTVVSTPPPTVRLYVSDLHAANDDDDDVQANPDALASAKTKVNSVAPPEILSSPSSDPISSGGDAAAGSGSVASASRHAPADNCVNTSQQRKCSQPNDRKLSASGGDSGNVTTTSGGNRPDAVTTTTTVADVTWLTDHHGKPGPLPFPPLNVTFDDDNESDTAAGGAIDSCDSFHQSTETVVMRDAAAAARKAAAAARRKSVYYNATPEPTTATSASSDADLVALPRLKQRHHHQHHQHHQQQQRRHHSQRAAGEAEVEKITSLDRGGGASSRRHASRAENVGVAGGGSGRRRKHGVSAADVSGADVTSPLDAGPPPPPQQRNDATCRVTRSTVHSDSRAVADSTTATVRFRSSETLRPAAHVLNPGPGGAKVTPGTSAAAATTTRTYGPACVIVTPLSAVDECARFPVSVAPASRDRDRSRPLDAAELLRSEYETSFGGDVNPLVLYSTGGGATGTAQQEVTLSKQTVYDNVQYFNM